MPATGLVRLARQCAVGIGLHCFAGGPCSAQALADYALGQPLSDARLVIPVGKTSDTWHLRCTDEADPPQGLRVSAEERAAGVIRCWPMLVSDCGEHRTAFPLRHAVIATEELIFVHGKVVVIRIHRGYGAHRTSESADSEWRDPSVSLPRP